MRGEYIACIVSGDGKEEIGTMSHPLSHAVKSFGSFWIQTLRWYHLWRTLAWVICGILIIYMIVLPTGQDYFAFFQTLQTYFSFFETLVLVSVLLAMLNTRRADPTVLVNRTLVYTIFATCLALIYLGGVTSLRLLIAPGWPRVLIGIFVLGMIALIRPLRTRVQTIIDKRFYRHQQDAATAIDAFTSTLREEIDLDQLSERLIAVVQKVMQPRTVSLWLRSRTATHNESNGIARLVRWQQNIGKRADGVPGFPGSTAGNTPLMGTVEMNIPRHDPMFTSILNTPDVVEVDQLHLNSPVLRNLQAIKVKLVLPLVSQGELIGWLNLGPRLDEQDYAHYEHRLLTTLSSQVAPALRVAQMVREQQVQIREHEQIEQELRTAQFIQQALLPKDVPMLPGWQIAVHYQPARSVGGDFYDFLPFEDGQVGIIIGDATDKGMPAALVMAITCTMLRTAAQGLTSPGEVLARVNELLYGRIPTKMFVTCFYALLDPKSGRLCFANAGQDWPFRRHSGGVCELRATGMPLGMMPGSRYEEQEVTLGPGESSLFYSDGLVEAHNSRREMFGLPRLMALIGEHPEGTAFIDLLLSELATFTGADWEQEDDVTMVTLQRAALPTEEKARQADRDSWHLLSEWTIPSIPGNERQVMEQVASVVQPLHQSSERLADLKTAVAEATMNAMEHGNQYRTDKVVTLQVLSSETAIAVRVRDQGEDRSIPEPASPDLNAKLTEQQTSRGWGLFLIKHLVDELYITNDWHAHMVELVMHRKEVNHSNQKG